MVNGLSWAGSGTHTTLKRFLPLSDELVWAQNATLIVKWNEAAVTLFTAAALPPPVTARAVFVTHNCIYDTWAAYDRTAVGLYWPYDLRQRRVFSRLTPGAPRLSGLSDLCLPGHSQAL